MLEASILDERQAVHAPECLPAAARPLRVMFVATTMPVGGAETLLVNLIRRMDRERFAPELCCLKHFGPLGEQLAGEVPAFERLLAHKFDVRVYGRLARLFRSRAVDAVVTVGTGGDKMFWGRLAARRARVPVIVSALHSTGLPDRVEWLNRRLAPWTDAFIAVAEAHAAYLAEHEGCTAAKVRVIRNGVDTERFRPLETDARLRAELGLPLGAPVATIVAALRPEKNHELFLRAASIVRQPLPSARFLIVGDGPERTRLEAMRSELGLGAAVQFAGTRSDIPQILSASDVFVLTSHMEASPVSILEAMACGKPVVATRVGSIGESVRDSLDGYLVPAGDAEQMAARLVELMSDPNKAAAMGRAARAQVVATGSIDAMVKGYEDLLLSLFLAKSRL